MSNVLENAVQDARYLLRALRKSPAFTVVIVLTLAIGIGITTAVVSVTDHVLLRSLPFRDADRLVVMMERDQYGTLRVPSYPTVQDWQNDAGTAQAFEGVSYVRGDGVQLCLDGDCETIGSAFVEPGFFTLLGVRAQLGRLLVADEHRDAAPIAVISHRLWRGRLGGDPTVIGRTISVDSIPTTVVGVLPVGAVYPEFADLWQPMSIYRHPEILRQRGFHADSRTLARLHAGVDSARAMARMRTIGALLAAEYPAEQAHWMPDMMPLRRELVGDVGTMLWLLSVAATAVLLLACANVAGLLLARVTTRVRELALRSAIGASGARVVRQLLTESLVLAVIGGVAGATLALWSLQLSRRFLDDRLPRMDELTLDWRVLLLALAATLLTAVLCGVWPALLALRTRSADALRASTSGSVGGRGASRLRRALVTAQFALALVMLVAAGLLVQSFRRATGVDVGFDPRGLLTLRISPPTTYAEPEPAAALYARLMDAARSVPDVRDAAFINHAPFGRASITTSLSIEGRPTLESSNQVFYRTVSSSYLRTMRMRLRAGRWFDATDMRAPAGQFVLNETAARQYWPDGNAVGQHITVTRASQDRDDFGQPVSGTVVGVVADVHQWAQDVAPAAEVYVPYTLEPWPWGMLVVRTPSSTRAIPGLIRAIRSVEPALLGNDAAAAGEFGVMDETIAARLQPRVMSIRFITAFAAIALLLACVGMYGIVAHGIAQRTREIGVRKALGATNASILSLIARESGFVVLVGATAGTLCAWAGARLIRSMLFRTAAVDVAAYGAALATLGAVALVATLLPARRATALDPAATLRAG